jgi:hypothetical protein
VRPGRVRAAGIPAWRGIPVQSEEWAVIAGEGTKLQVTHFKLSCSRAFFLRAYPQQTHEMLFDAHNHAFRVLAGVPRRGAVAAPLAYGLPQQQPPLNALLLPPPVPTQ